MNLCCLSAYSEDNSLKAIENINSKIDTVKNQIHKEELNAMEAEVNSQSYIMYEWEKYVDEIQNAEEADKKIEELEKELKKLKAERALMKKNNSLDESKP